MRTTIEFDDDTARAIEELRRSEGLGVSEAVNELVRRGLMPRSPKQRFEQRTVAMGLKIDVSNVAEALDLLEGPDAR
jgi:hypothetical protein